MIGRVINYSELRTELRDELHFVNLIREQPLESEFSFRFFPPFKRLTERERRRGRLQG